jgi:hypothetical protein
MTHQSLEEALQDAERPVEMLRNSRMGPYAFPVTAELTNRRDEQRAWRKTRILFVQRGGARHHDSRDGRHLPGGDARHVLRPRAEAEGRR